MQESLGDAGDRALVRRIRTHGNFAEYAPMGILLMGLAEVPSGPACIIHALGLLLLSGRSVHAYGVGRDPQVSAYRVAGMALTFAALVTGALLNLIMASISEW